MIFSTKIVTLVYIYQASAAEFTTVDTSQEPLQGYPDTISVKRATTFYKSCLRILRATHCGCQENLQENEIQGSLSLGDWVLIRV